jgi:GTP1/Obg family GTP-binding protein
VSEDLLEEIELESVERFTGLHNAHINDRARYYVTHSPEHNKVSLSELRKIRNKSKKIKRSYKKQLRKQSHDISKRYGGR